MTTHRPGSSPRPAAEALASEGRRPDGRFPPTEKQTDYIEALRRKLALPHRMLSSHCEAVFGHPFREIDRRQASALIDELCSWTELPAEFARAKGQQDLPGFGE